MIKRVPLRVKRHVYGGWSETGRLQLSRLRGAAYRSIGVVLICHLQIEHYIDHLLRLLSAGQLDFEGAGLSFAQKVKLLSQSDSPLAELNLLAAIRELNALRNRLSHRLDDRRTEANVTAMRAALQRHFRSDVAIPNEPFKVVEVFTAVAVAGLVGYIAAFDAAKNPVVAAALTRQTDENGTGVRSEPANPALQPTSRAQGKGRSRGRSLAARG